MRPQETWDGGWEKARAHMLATHGPSPDLASHCFHASFSQLQKELSHFRKSELKNSEPKELCKWSGTEISPSFQTKFTFHDGTVPSLARHDHVHMKLFVCMPHDLV